MPNKTTETAPVIAEEAKVEVVSEPQTQSSFEGEIIVVENEEM